MTNSFFYEKKGIKRGDKKTAMDFANIKLLKEKEMTIFYKDKK
jgi:hypothetical protein